MKAPQGKGAGWKAIRRPGNAQVALSEEKQAEATADKQFLAAINDGDISTVTSAMRKGQEVNIGDESGNSSCHFAVKVADMKLLKALVENGAYVDYANDIGHRPINACFDRQEMAKDHMEWLLSLKDANDYPVIDVKTTNPRSGNTLLMDACWVGNLQAVRSLLKTGAFDDKALIEHTNKQGQTAMQCVRHANSQSNPVRRPMVCLFYFLRTPCSNEPARVRVCLRSIAACRGSEEVVQVLTEAGADPNAVEKNCRRLSKETPEQIATASGHTETAKYLRSLQVATDAVKFGARMKMKVKNNAAGD